MNYSKVLFKKSFFRTKILLFVSAFFLLIGIVFIVFQHRKPVDMDCLLDNQSLQRFDVVYVNDYQQVGIIKYNDKEYSIIRIRVHNDIYYFPVEGIYNGINSVGKKYIGGMDDPLKLLVDSCLNNSEIKDGIVLPYTLYEMPIVGIPFLFVGLFGVVIGLLIMLITTKEYMSLFGTDRKNCE